MLNIPEGLKTPKLYKRAIKKYDLAISTQKTFWCPGCDTWDASKRCETVAAFPKFGEDKKITLYVFGFCEPCVKRAAGMDPSEYAKLAIAERAAKRAAAGIPDPVDDGRVKIVIVAED